MEKSFITLVPINMAQTELQIRQSFEENLDKMSYISQIKYPPGRHNSPLSILSAATLG